MISKRPASIALLAAAMYSPFLSGCVITASTPAYARHEHVIVVPPPPPPRVEVVHVAPYPGHVWIGGHWTWHAHNHKHYWAPGHWAPPRHGHRYVPHRWERHGDHWRERPGRWERHDDRRDRRGRGDRY